MPKKIIGIDIGGTSINLGLFTSEGELLYKWTIPTRKENSGKNIIDDLYHSLHKMMEEHLVCSSHILGIGIGIPGFIDKKSGYVHEAINLGWKNMNFKQELEQKVNLPILIENDANNAVLGENWKGAGEGAKDLVAVTLGTGVGGGIISNGFILNGSSGVGGEFGHIYVASNGIRCNCGNEGCLETIASAPGIVRQAVDAIAKEPSSLLYERYKHKGEISSRDVFQLAEKGEKIALEVVNYTSQTLGGVLANLSVIVNPEKILIGGGVSQAGLFLIDKIRIAYEEKAMSRVKDSCEIKIATLGNDAGIYGGAFLVKQNIKDVLI